MDDKIKKYLTDIKVCILSIDEHLQYKRDFKLYTSNKTIRRAVERELEIIGEAMSRILKLDENINISYSRVVVDLRNIVIHAYDNINDAMIWKIIVKDIPLLQEEVEELLKI